MVGLLDVAVKTENVHGATVTGIGIKGVVLLLTRFPELKTMLGGGKVDPEKLVALAPDAAAAVIAAGCGEMNPQAEEHAGTMPLEIQMDFLEAIQRTTMPSGFGPFVERLERLGVISPEQKPATPATNLPKPSST